MLDEHMQLVDALRNHRRAATADHHSGYAGLAQKLILHAMLEEEVLYPASILVGEYIKLRLSEPRTVPGQVDDASGSGLEALCLLESTHEE